MSHQEQPEIKDGKRAAELAIEVLATAAAELDPAAKAEFWRTIRDVIEGWIPQVQIFNR